MILLDDYKYMEETGCLPQHYNGLCHFIGRKHVEYYDLLFLFTPDIHEIRRLDYQHKNIQYWASDTCFAEWGRATDLRKTIVAFILVIHGDV